MRRRGGREGERAVIMEVMMGFGFYCGFWGKTLWWVCR